MWTIYAHFSLSYNDVSNMISSLFSFVKSSLPNLYVSIKYLHWVINLFWLLSNFYRYLEITSLYASFLCTTYFLFFIDITTLYFTLLWRFYPTKYWHCLVASWAPDSSVWSSWHIVVVLPPVLYLLYLL